MRSAPLGWFAAPLMALLLGCPASGSGGSSGGAGGTSSGGTSAGSSTSSGGATGGSTSGGSTAGTSSSGGTTGGGGYAPVVSGCQVFPDDNPWNRDVSGDALDPNSDNYMAYMTQGGANVHPDFASDPTYGIPWDVVPGTQAFLPIQFADPDSDPGPYPIPMTARIEAGADHHVLILDTGNCKLYEVYGASPATLDGGPGWACNGGAIFDLHSGQLRADCRTSADAAGLPILPGLVRYTEVASGAYRHAVRFTMLHTQKAFIHPATHFSSSITDTTAPPMGLRLRLKASTDLSTMTGGAHVIAVALQHYGMLLADNGSDFYITGETNPLWDDTNLNQLKQIPGSAFEVVQTGAVVLPAQCP
jgi:hypothetical protein